MKRKASRKSRRSRKSRKISVKKIRSALLRSMETKKLRFNAAPTVKCDTVLSYNLMQQSAAQGVTESTFIGNKIYLKGIKLKMQADNSVGPSESLQMRVMILRAKAYRTTTSLTKAELYETSLYQNARTGLVDHTKAKVIYQKYITITPQYANQKITKKLSAYVKINKQFEFKDFTTDYEARGWNYYLVMHGEGSAALPGDNLFVSPFNCVLYIKDA